MSQGDKGLGPLGGNSPSWSSELLWIVKQTVAFPASRVDGMSPQHWYTTFGTSAGMNLMATATFSTGRLLRVHAGAEDLNLASGRRTREGAAC